MMNRTVRLAIFAALALLPFAREARADIFTDKCLYCHDGSVASGSLIDVPHAVIEGGWRATVNRMNTFLPFTNGAKPTLPAYTASEINQLVAYLEATYPTLTITGPASLSAGTTGTAYGPVQFTLSGNFPPYTWTATGLPSGLSISTGGSLSGTPAAGSQGSYNPQFTVTDNVGTSKSVNRSLTINGPALSITGPASLSSGSEGVMYSAVQFTATGGTGTGYSWTASGLPSGMSISAGGSLSGTPAVGSQGSYNPQFTVKDSSNAMTSVVRSLTIAGPALSVTGPALLSAGTVGASYGPVQFTASGGTGAGYSWTATGLPSGLSISPGGVLSGTPAAGSQGPYTPQFTVKDSSNAMASSSRPLTINTAGAPLTVSGPGSLPAATVGTAYGPVQFSASGGTGTGYTWTATGLPSGLSISAGGSLSGTPAAGTQGPYNPQFTVKDSSNASANSSLALTVAAASGPCTYTLNAGGEAFTAQGGSATIIITAPAGCAWTVDTRPPWVTVTSAQSGVGNGSITFLVGPNSGGALSGAIKISGTPFNVEQQAASIPGLGFVGSMPHLASAGSWETTFTLVNIGATAAIARTNLWADAGSSLLLPLTFPQNLPVGSLLAPSLDRTIPPNGSLILDSTGPDSQTVQVGAAQLLATGNVGGFAIFKYKFVNQEAVVPLETRNAPSYTVAYDNTNAVALGIALQNVSASGASISVIIRNDSGVVIGTDTLFLAGGGHTSFVLPTQYPVTANSRGTIEFDAPSGGRISVLGIRFTPPGTLTTIPVLANVTSAGGSAAHIASGGGWKTTVVLVNVGISAALAHLKFFNDGGNALTLPVTFPQTSVNLSASQVDQSIAAHGSLIIESTGPDTSPVLVGSMQLTTNGNISGYVIFRYTPNGQEASTPFENRGASAYVIPFDHTGNMVTGTAVNNASAQAINVSVTVRDDSGVTIGIGSLSLPPNGHLSFSLATQFPATANKRGTVEFDPPPGMQINVLGIRTPPALTFTTLPPLSH